MGDGFMCYESKMIDVNIFVSSYCIVIIIIFFYRMIYIIIDEH